MHDNLQDRAFRECEKVSKAYFKRAPEAIKPLAASGSSRRYFRIFFEDRTLIACYSENIRENETFLRLCSCILENGIKVPEVYKVSVDRSTYLLEDLGDTDLLSVIKNNHPEKWRMIREAVTQLVAFQSLNKEKWEEIVEFPPFDAELICNDFKYVTENLIIPTQVSTDEEKLKKEFEHVERVLLSYPEENWGLMYRDFQSRNIMIKGMPYFIDFQSSRYGPGIYDLVSFAWQAKAGFNAEERQKIIEIYTDEWERKGKGIKALVAENIDYWALFRILQTLGAYGLRGLKEGKSHFIESIPLALQNAEELLEQPMLGSRLPELNRVIGEMRKIFCNFVRKNN